MYGYRPNDRPYVTASSSGQGDSLRCPENDSAKSEKSSDHDVKERTPETSTATKKRKTVASSSTTPLGWALVDETNVLHGLRTMQSRNVSSRRLSEKRLKNTT